MAHIMLPGKKTDCFANDGHDLKYAENAINALAALLRKENPNFLLDCETCVVGGANVLQKGNDHISKDNIASALNELKRHAITINKASVGGVLRRQIICDVATGVTMVTTGDCPAQEFYRFGVSLMGVSV